MDSLVRMSTEIYGMNKKFELLGLVETLLRGRDMYVIVRAKDRYESYLAMMERDDDYDTF